MRYSTFAREWHGNERAMAKVVARASGRIFIEIFDGTGLNRCEIGSARAYDSSRSCEMKFVRMKGLGKLQ